MMEALHRYDKSYPIYDNDFTKNIVCANPTTDCWFNKCEHCKNGKVFVSKFPYNDTDNDMTMTDDDDDYEDVDEDVDNDDDVENGDKRKSKYVKWYQWQSQTMPDGKETLEKSLIRGPANLLYTSFV